MIAWIVSALAGFLYGPAITWTPVSGPVAGYELRWTTDGSLLGTSAGPVFAVRDCDAWHPGDAIVVRAFDAAGNYGPDSVPSEAVPEVCGKPGDMDGDGDVDASDFPLWLRAFVSG